ncbi:MAG: ketoacyl-ACP synthase III [Bacteroidia bacterium]|nr:ketoacyl-ACP synthase III [Bacteroidia bacterium]
MAFFSIANIALKGISAAVPKTVASNSTLQGYSPEELQKLISTLGIQQRRVAQAEQCASDFCMAAANQLINELNWNRSEIDVLFFVSQTPDHTLPGTSMYIQEKLGLSKSCATFDINQGCAGYVYGLSLISSFMSASGLKKGLLLVGDTITRLISPHDRSLLPIFSDCGTATALEFDKSAQQLNFNISTEGADYQTIIVPEGGARFPINQNSFEYKQTEGNIQRQGHHLAMKGLDVFNFSLKKVTPNVEELLLQSYLSTSNIDYFVFHQANQLILEALTKKLGLDSSKVPSSLKEFGNTSGATIPLTIVTNMSAQNRLIDCKMVLSGFGVGLSLASAVVNFNQVLCPVLIEL